MDNKILECKDCGTRYLKKDEYYHKFQECNGKKKKTIYDNFNLNEVVSEDSLYAINLNSQLNSENNNNNNNFSIFNNNNNDAIHSEDSIFAMNLHNNLNNPYNNIHSEDSIFAMNLQNQLFSEPTVILNNNSINNRNNNNNNNRNNMNNSIRNNNNNNNLNAIQEEISEVSNSISNLHINNIINNNNNNNNNNNPPRIIFINNNNNNRENSENNNQNEEEPSRRVVFRLSGLAMLGVLIDFLEQMEKEEHKVDEKLLKRIPEIKVEDKNKLSEDNKKCTICQEEYNNNDKVIALPCLHFFHTDCIKDWFSGQNTCPNCKFLITKSNVYGQEGIEQTPEESSSKI